MKEFAVSPNLCGELEEADSMENTRMMKVNVDGVDIFIQKELCIRR